MASTAWASRGEEFSPRAWIRLSRVMVKYDSYWSSSRGVSMEDEKKGIGEGGNTHAVKPPGIFELVLPPVLGNLENLAVRDKLHEHGGDRRRVQDCPVEIDCKDFDCAHGL